MRKLLLLSALIAQGAIGQNKSFNMQEFYPIEGSHSYISFSVLYMGSAKVQGNFAKFNGTFRFDPKDLDKTSVSFSVDVSSIDTNLEWRDKDLKSANWFEAEKYPSLTFSSKSAKQKGKTILVTGDLTAKDVTKEVTIELTSTGILDDIRGDAQVIISGSYTIDRTEYGIAGERWSQIKEGIMGVSKEVTIEFSMLGKQIRKENFSNWVRNEKRPPGRLYAAYKRGGTKETFAEFEKLKTEIEVNQAALNTVGYFLLKQDNYKDAITILERNKDEFPDQTNSYDSLGEAYALSGDTNKARINFEIAIEKDPSNYNAREILRHLK